VDKSFFRPVHRSDCAPDILEGQFEVEQGGSTSYQSGTTATARREDVLTPIKRVKRMAALLHDMLEEEEESPFAATHCPERAAAEEVDWYAAEAWIAPDNDPLVC
jgi:hypothetical protein